MNSYEAGQYLEDVSNLGDPMTLGDEVVRQRKVILELMRRLEVLESKIITPANPPTDPFVGQFYDEYDPGTGLWRKFEFTGDRWELGL